METKLLQTFRYKLQSRVRKLNSTEWNLYHWQLVQFWEFLKSREIFDHILTQLQQNSTVLEKVTPIFEGKLDYGKYITFDKEEDQAAGAYFIIKYCVEQEINNAQLQKEIAIGSRYSMEDKYSDSIEAFNNFFVQSLYDYIDEQLDDQSLLLYLLLRYKRRSEWFAREKLFNLYLENTKTGEDLLALDLYEYLYSQGVEFHIQPVSATGEIDLISEQIGDERLLLDAKIFKGEASYIKHGFNQIYTYTLTYNQPYGYLVIFNVSDKQLTFSSPSPDPQIAHFTVNGKTLFLLTVDIAPRPTASKRGNLKVVNLKDADLLTEIKQLEPDLG